MSAIVVAGGRVVGSGGKAFAVGNFTFTVDGNQFLLNGVPTQMRGWNQDGLEYVAVQNQSTTANWGGIRPNWPYYQTWRPNYTRIPIHGDSWLGNTTYDGAGGSYTISSATSTSAVLSSNWSSSATTVQASFADLEQRTATVANGSPNISWSGPLTTTPSAGQNVDLFYWGSARNNDPQGDYVNTVLVAVAEAQNINTVPEIDLHWIGPTMTILGVTHILTCNNQQPTFADTHAIALWQSICAKLGSNVPGQTVTLASNGQQFTINNKLVCFGIINEPFLDSYGQSLSAGSADLALLNGGTNGRYPNGSGGPFNVQSTWTMAGYQATLNAIRATGAQNVCLFGGNSYGQNVKNCANWIPTDTLSPAQTAAYVHYYPNTYNGNNPWPYTAYGALPLVGSDSNYAAPSSADWQYITGVLASGIAVISNECGDAWGCNSYANAGELTTYGAPALSNLQSHADSLGFSIAPFSFNPPQGTTAGNILIPPVQGNQGTQTAQSPALGMGLASYNWMVGHA